MCTVITKIRSAAPYFFYIFSLQVSLRSYFVFHTNWSFNVTKNLSRIYLILKFFSKIFNLNYFLVKSGKQKKKKNAFQKANCYSNFPLYGTVNSMPPIPNIYLLLPYITMYGIVSYKHNFIWCITEDNTHRIARNQNTYFPRFHIHKNKNVYYHYAQSGAQSVQTYSLHTQLNFHISRQVYKGNNINQKFRRSRSGPFSNYLIRICFPQADSEGKSLETNRVTQNSRFH